MNFYKKFEDRWIYKDFSKGKDGKYYCSTKFETSNDTVPAARIFIRLTIFNFIMALVFINISYLVFVLFTWFFFLSWFMETVLRRKMCAGYPRLDHKDATGISMFVMISFLIMFLVVW